MKNNLLKRMISCSLCLCVVLGGVSFSLAASNAGIFPDTEDHWAKDSIQYVISHGWFAGTSESNFEPESYLTRGMYVTILEKYAGVENTTKGAVSTKFVDVPKDAYYAGSVAWANKIGLVSGIDETHFAPGEYITREQAIYILYKYAEYMGYDTSGTVEFSDYYVDFGILSSYAERAMQWAVSHRLISSANKTGKGQLSTWRSTTRAEAATILHRFDRRIAPHPDEQ